MNYYHHSKNLDVYGRNLEKMMRDCVSYGEKGYHRYYATRWLAWYRIFYRLNDEKNRKKQIVWFLEEITTLVKLKGVKP